MCLLSSIDGSVIVGSVGLGKSAYASYIILTWSMGRWIFSSPMIIII